MADPVIHSYFSLTTANTNEVVTVFPVYQGMVNSKFTLLTVTHFETKSILQKGNKV